MPGAVYLCGTDDECPRHGKFLYFCSPCHDEWAEKNPLTVAAIAELARGKGSVQKYKDAKKKDRENRESNVQEVSLRQEVQDL